MWQTAFLGDAVLTLPLLHSIRQAYPDAEIIYFVRKGLKSLFQFDPGFEVQECDKYGRDRGLQGLGRFIKRLQDQAFDLWISPHTSFRSALTARYCGAATRIGYNLPWYNRLAYSHTVSRFFQELNEIERVLQLLKPLNLEPATAWPRLALSREQESLADDFWSKNISRPVLGVHPGSTWATKKWPEEYFARVIDMVQESLDVQVLLFAGPGEEASTREILSRIRHQDRVINLAGKLDLTGLAAFLSRLDCYLCNDSGPMHLAWTQNIPVVALFGPTTRELGFFPRGEHSRVLESPLDCRPCGLHGSQSCPQGHHRCMLDIDPETVFQAVRDKIYA